VAVVGAHEDAAYIEVGHGLLERVIAGLEAGGAGRAERGVERIAQTVGEFVAAVVEAGVVVPLAPLAARTGHQLHVEVLAFGDGAVAVRVELLPVGFAVGIAEVVGAFGIALVVGAERIGLGGRAERDFGVEPGVEILAGAVAQGVVALAGQGQVVGGLCLPRRDLVEPGAVGGFAVLQFQADAQEAAVIAQRGADLGAEKAGLAVGQGAADRLEVGMVGAEAGFDGATLGGIVQDHVDHPRHRVGAVQRAGAVAKHLDALDGADRDGVEVHRRGALADLAVGVDQRRVVAALAVDQHQHLVRRQPAQLRRAHVVGTAGVGLPREVE